MRRLITFFWIVANLLATSLATAADSIGPGPRLAIRVEAGGWGTALPDDIETVLDSVAAELLRFFPDQPPSAIVVAFDVHGPRVLFEKNARGEFVVFLSVRDTRWDQFAYQFSHELCHIVSHHDHKDITAHGRARDNQWFEEAVCETVSLFSLNRLASRWEESPPHPHWGEYAPAFREYAARLLGQPHRTLPGGLALADWYRQNRQALRHDPYLRDKTELVAGVLLGLFECNPASLSAIGHLNDETAATSASFADYLMSWFRCCPPAQQDLVRQAMAAFGIADHASFPTLALAAAPPAGPADR